MKFPLSSLLILLVAPPFLAAADAQSHLSLTGQVVTPPYAPNLTFTVESGNRCYTLFDRRNDRSERVRPGDVVRLSASVDSSRGSGRTNLNCRQLAVIGHHELTATEPVGIKEFLSGTYTDKRAAVRGTVSAISSDDIDSQFIDIALSDGEEMVYAYYAGDQGQVSDLRPLLGKRVVAEGVGRKDMGTRTFTGPALEMADRSAMRTVGQPQADPFAVPEVETADPIRLPDIRSGCLRKAIGTVIARWNDDTFLIRTQHGRTIQAEVTGNCLPQLNDTVEVVGHLETDLIDLYLSRAFWRQKAARTSYGADTPADISLSQLFKNVTGLAITDTSRQGKTFRITGTVKSISVGRDGYRQMLVADGEHAIPVNCSSAQAALDTLAEGSRVEVTGVCVKDSDIWRAASPLPKVRGLFLVLRHESDLRVLETPPWWTPLRFSLALGVLLAFVISVLIWNAALRALVIRKSRALLKEQAEKLSETLKVDERTRLAAELHDFHSQNLTAIAYQISSARNSCREDPSNVEALLTTAVRMLKSCRTDLRRCLWDLRNDALDEPDFATAIRKTITPVAGSANLSVRFAGRRSQISDSTAHTLLSILRELTANAVVHGHATSIRIAGEQRLQTIRFSVRDNGCGFVPEARPGQNEGHFGIDGIRDRIKRLGGTLEIESHPDEGTYVRLTINHVLVTST